MRELRKRVCELSIQATDVSIACKTSDRVIDYHWWCMQLKLKVTWKYRGSRRVNQKFSIYRLERYVDTKHYLNVIKETFVIQIKKFLKIFLSEWQKFLLLSLEIEVVPNFLKLLCKKE